MNKSFKIEFHVCRNEIDDCVVRMADLIKEGYTIEVITNEPPSMWNIFSEPSIHITLQKEENLR